jgi:hypothetical protein
MAESNSCGSLAALTISLSWLDGQVLAGALTKAFVLTTRSWD